MPTFLNRNCAADDELRREVKSLLAAGDQAGSSFRRPLETVGVTKGTRLGDYEVQSLLGSGGMGEVCRARDLRLRRDVAVKVLPQFLSSNPERLRRFEQEALATAALNHPNILTVYQMGRHDGVPYLVTELLGGDHELLDVISIPYSGNPQLHLCSLRSCLSSQTAR